MSNLTAPPRTEPVGLPAPTFDPVADTALPPPPELRVPAVPSPALPPLTSRPIVPVPPTTAPASPFASEPEQPSLAAPTFAAPSVPISPAAPTLAGTDDSTVPAPQVSAPTAAAPPEAAPAAAAPAVPTFAMPTLPTVTAAKPSAPPTDLQPQYQPDVTARVDEIQTPNASKKPASTKSLGGTLLRTVGLIILAGALGAGANIGYGYWQGTTGNVATAFDGTQLASWPQVDPPAIRYADSTTVLRTAAGTRTITSHTSLVNGDRVVAVTDVDPAGALVEYTGDEAVALVGAPVVTGVFMISDVFPAESIPFITVLEGVERQLPIGPINTGRPAPTPVSGEAATEQAAPAAGMWHYRVIVDIEAFRASEPAAFETWERRLGAVAVARLEAWVDGAGIVRQVAADVDGTSVVHTLVSGAAQSTQFDVPVTPDVAVAPDVATAADPTEVTE